MGTTHNSGLIIIVLLVMPMNGRGCSLVGEPHLCGQHPVCSLLLFLFLCLIVLVVRQYYVVFTFSAQRYALFLKLARKYDKKIGELLRMIVIVQAK